jgi:hypothetical protein
MRRVILLAACLVLTACKESPADTGVVDSGAAKSVHAASPVDDTPTHDTGAVAPTDKPSEDKHAEQVSADAGAAQQAEVEILGAITGVPEKSKLVVTVSKKECKPNDAELDLFGQAMSPTPASFFIEVFVPQGATGFLCVYALQGDQVVAFGTGDKNPMVMRGHGEVMFGGTKVALKPTSKWKAPAPLADAK